ncbi:hypothetical protein CPB85DRAFT_1261959 [Mucidula mucida]|nr:hypothetical protein CPB85DRAFT_1261959 [Mucidula mucida]
MFMSTISGDGRPIAISLDVPSECQARCVVADTLTDETQFIFFSCTSKFAYSFVECVECVGNNIGMMDYTEFQGIIDSPSVMCKHELGVRDIEDYWFLNGFGQFSDHLDAAVWVNLQLVAAIEVIVVGAVVGLVSRWWYTQLMLSGGLNIFGHLLDFLDVGSIEQFLRRYFLLVSYMNFGGGGDQAAIAMCLLLLYWVSANWQSPEACYFAVLNTYLVWSVCYTLCYLDIVLAQWHQEFFGPMYRDSRLD